MSSFFTLCFFSIEACCEYCLSDNEPERPDLWIIGRGPQFNEKSKEEKKIPLTLQELSCKAAGRSFKGGVRKSLQFLEELPYPKKLIKLIHVHLTFSEPEWDYYSVFERQHPTMNPNGRRIKCIFDHYNNLYPEVKERNTRYWDL